MANSKVGFIISNVKGLQSSKKRLERIEYHTLFLMVKMSGLNILKVKSFFCMVHPNPIVFKLHI